MAVYGNLLKSVNEGVHENVSFDQLFNFIYESDNEVNLMFERANLITILKEENTSLAIPKSIEDYTSNPEQVKKKFVDKIKDIVNKFVSWFITSIKDLKYKVNEFYVKHNFQDDFLSKWKSKVTWDNLQKAIKNGWEGIPNNIPSILVPVNLSDTKIVDRLNDIFKDTNTLIESMKDSNSEDELNKIEDEVNTLIEKLKDETRENILFSESEFMEMKRNIKVRLSKFRNGNVMPFLGYFVDSGTKDENKYYPQQFAFDNNKYFGENGQKEMKTIKGEQSLSIKLVKDISKTYEKDILKEKQKQFSKDENNFVLKAEYTACKYYYQSLSLFIKAASQSLNGLMGVLASQHKAAVQNYILYVHAINKFCTVTEK